MQKTIVSNPAMKLVGISLRTAYQQEIDKMKGKIFPCVQKYFQGKLFDKIPNRKNPGTTFCVYTDYDSDYLGTYTYFIGEEVTAYGGSLPEGFQTRTIPSQAYAKFTTTPAPMPDVIINAWKAIWKMTPKDFGGKRLYQADFEVYDERASDHQNIIMDLYVGIER